MKRAKIKASLMLEDTLRFPLMIQEVEITIKDFKKGMDFIYAKIQRSIIDRLTVIVDERELMEIFGEVPILKG